MARITRKGILAFFSILIFWFLFLNLNPTSPQDGSGWIAPAEADKLENPFANNPNVWKNMEQTFNTLCTVCHGAKGLGDGIGGMALTPRPANLVSSRVQKQSDGAIFWKITHGKSPMASYKDTFSEEQRWQLVKLIRHLAEK